MFSLKELVTDSAASRDQAAELHASLCTMFQQVAERPLGGLNAVTVRGVLPASSGELLEDQRQTVDFGPGARQGLQNPSAGSQTGPRKLQFQAEGVPSMMFLTLPL